MFKFAIPVLHVVSSLEAEKFYCKFLSFMNAKLWLLCLSFFTLLTNGCGALPLVATELPPASAQTHLPEFVDDPAHQTNMDPATPRQELVFDRNWGAMAEILKADSTLVREEMAGRLSSNQPLSLKLLAAAVLVFKNNDLGKHFFQSHARVIGNHLDDLYVTLSHIDISGPFLNGTAADMSWAEDLMVEALQNRTQLNRREALRIGRHISFSDTNIEIREIAVRHGRFPEILGKMRSQKALPVILSMIREGRGPDKLALRGAIGSLGTYKDKRVEPLLLEILNRHEDSEHWDTYGVAVGAASEMGLRGAVPILLHHLGDRDSYEGLRALAGKSAIPIIERAFPKLKSYARAEAELTLIQLRGGDVLPSLLRLLSRRNFLQRDEAVIWIEKLRDARSVPAMSKALCNDPDGVVRKTAIRVLRAVKTREAIAGLVDGLGCDYSGLEMGKVSADRDYNREYRDEIATTLKEITGSDFGIDKKKWTDWLTGKPKGEK